MRAVLLSGQGKDVRFVNQHDRVHDQPTPRHYQQKTPPPPRPQEIKLSKPKVIRLFLRKPFPLKWLKEKIGFKLTLFWILPSSFLCGNF